MGLVYYKEYYQKALIFRAYYLTLTHNIPLVIKGETHIAHLFWKWPLPQTSALFLKLWLKYTYVKSNITVSIHRFQRGNNTNQNNFRELIS
jgi:hypothetical protein